ncbi:response regulator [Hymenobacter sp. UV11]|uniref:FAD-dependent oxidoreductase n=1 Tax=Hymenobacter sp. UV11 TaxID=1849735 RepID=UPI00105BFF10|nr:FAD-dependent oxidoreductase [Hymenobacter sp. UV11]TDN36754.1 fused response regulator/thioredoxin-disulfide reductase [Hymenobacter sp. UV11]TFZ63713.1 response regulator [Hymenobacter sp. UV11]
MKKPLILTVDDDPQVLGAITRDLRQEFRQHYRILPVGSGPEALATLETLRTRAEPLALVLCDQRMPQVEGIEVLTRARALFPEAKRVLLTAYADTTAAIRAINSAQLDYYLLKPWDPPETLLYPTLHDLLASWQATYRPAYDGLRLLGYQWSPRSHALKDFLSGYLVGYQWLDMEQDAGARTLLAATGFSEQELPVVIYPNGQAVAQPDRQELARHLGLLAAAQQELYDVVIVGSGPAGLAAAVYGASEGLRTLLIERETPGGQAGSSSRIENYLGFPTGLSGSELTHRAWTQAIRLGAELMAPQEVTSLAVQDGYKLLTLSDGSQVRARAVVLTMGVSYRVLQAPGLERLSGAGVYYGAARTEARSCSAQPVFVVGGGNSAGQAAMYLSGFASRVYLVIRGESLGASMSAYLIEQLAQTPNVEILPRTQVREACGGNALGAVVVQAEGQEPVRYPARALFIFIGTRPSTEWISPLALCDPKGFLLTGRELLADPRFAPIWPESREPHLLETSVPGLFAAGDGRAGAMARVASAVGEGSMAIKFVHQYLGE